MLKWIVVAIILIAASGYLYREEIASAAKAKITENMFVPADDEIGRAHV